MDFEQWWIDNYVDPCDEYYDSESLTPDGLADMVKQFGFDWVSGEGDAEEVALTSVLWMIESVPGTWDKMSLEASQILINELINLKNRGPEKLPVEDCLINEFFNDCYNPLKGRIKYCVENCRFKCVEGQDYKKRK